MDFKYVKKQQLHKNQIKCTEMWTRCCIQCHKFKTW